MMSGRCAPAARECSTFGDQTGIGVAIDSANDSCSSFGYLLPGDAFAKACVPVGDRLPLTGIDFGYPPRREPTAGCESFGFNAEGASSNRMIA